MTNAASQARKLQMGQRIGALIEDRKTSQTALAKFLGVKPQSVQAWIAGTTSPRRKYITGIADFLRAHEQYIELGTGPRDLDKQPTGGNVAMDRHSEEMVKIMALMDDTERADLVNVGRKKLAKSLSKKGGPVS